MPRRVHLDGGPDLLGQSNEWSLRDLSLDPCELGARNQQVDAEALLLVDQPLGHFLRRPDDRACIERSVERPVDRSGHSLPPAGHLSSQGFAGGGELRGLVGNEDRPHHQRQGRMLRIGQQRAVVRQVVGDLIEGLHRGREVGEVASSGLGETFWTKGGHRERGVRALVGLERRALGSPIVFAPEREDPVEGVIEAVALLRRRNPEGFKHRLLEAPSQSDQESSLWELVEGRNLGCDLLRGVKREE